LATKQLKLVSLVSGASSIDNAAIHTVDHDDH